MIISTGMKFQFTKKVSLLLGYEGIAQAGEYHFDVITGNTPFKVTGYQDYMPDVNVTVLAAGTRIVFHPLCSLFINYNRLGYTDNSDPSNDYILNTVDASMKLVF